MSDAPIRQLYRALLTAWNQQDAAGMAACYTADGSQVGFDGSQIDGRAEIEKHLAAIFADHQTAAYIGIVRELRYLTEDVALLRAVAGMLPPGGNDLNPDAHSIQSLVAVRVGKDWRAALFHNTPAAWHGRPEDREQLTRELRQAYRQSDAA
jgi:uncharacterized protein (TIGR02246 family)